jgi:uncharacterized protein (DUF1697 family)
MTASDRRAILLRAVNVGGAKLPMAELRAIAADLGATDVSTYIASGNLIATVPGKPEAFDRALEKAVQQRYGFSREVISRTREQLEAALAAHPFEVIESRYSYISFLLGTPTKAAIEVAGKLPTGDDRWAVVGDDLHLRYADGAGSEQLRTAALMKALGVPGTARNLNTVQALIQRMR